MCYLVPDPCFERKRAGAATATSTSVVKRRRRDSAPGGEGVAMFRRKRRRSSPRGPGGGGGRDFFDDLPDDLVLSVLSRVGASASAPPDLINVLLTYGPSPFADRSFSFPISVFPGSLLVHLFYLHIRLLIVVANGMNRCKRFKALGLHSMVLSKASPNAFAVRAHAWCDSAHRFLKLFADAGNVEASYTLGMVITKTQMNPQTRLWSS